MRLLADSDTPATDINVDTRNGVVTLFEKRDLQGAEIDVEVKNGVARLTGTVADDMQRLSAATTARATPCVRAVQDELRTTTD